MRFRGLKLYSGGTLELCDGYAAEGGFYDNFHLPPHGIVDPDGNVQYIHKNHNRELEVWIDAAYLYDIYTDINICPPNGAGFYACTGIVPTSIQIQHGRGNGLMTIVSLTAQYGELIHRCEKWCEEGVRDITCLN